ncbi:hypothetical protein D3C74_10170 [compost metagenome]
MSRVKLVDLGFLRTVDTTLSIGLVFAPTCALAKFPVSEIAHRLDFYTLSKSSMVALENFSTERRKVIELRSHDS